MRFVLAAAASLALALLAPANATVYTFNVNYSGGGVANLAGGSDDPLATTMNAGDSFTYNLLAQGGVWNTISADSIFPLFSFAVSEAGTRTGDFTLNLKSGGATIFSYSELGAINSFVHLGTNAVPLPNGLTFDEWSLSYTILAADTTSTPISLLPWPGQAPEQRNPRVITYTSVPEPSTLLMLLVGVAGLLGLAAWQRRAALV